MEKKKKSQKPNNKQPITGEMDGEITPELMKNFNNRLAIALIKQYGETGARKILEELEKE